MKYYDEKTKMQAMRMNVEEQLNTGSAGCLAGDPVGAFFGEGHRNIMKEINDDVKALDELFRGISFRKPETKHSKEDAAVQEEETRNDV